MFYTISTIAPVCRKLHNSGQTLVLATGFFDLLHQEHLNFLQKAKSAGDLLLVGIESDLRARAVKGQNRPVEDQLTRAKHLLTETDFIILLPDDFDHQEAYDSLMAAVRPAVYAVSSHTEHLENKRLLTAKYGGELRIVHQHNPAVSTSKLLHQPL